MDSDTFQLFVARFEAYVDRIQQDTVDYDALVDTIVSRLNVTFNNIQPIDFENISPVVDPIRAGGEHLNFFNGTLQVPEIDREHNVQTPGGRGLSDLDDSLETSGVPGIVKTLRFRPGRSRFGRPGVRPKAKTRRPKAKPGRSKISTRNQKSKRPGTRLRRDGSGLGKKPKNQTGGLKKPTSTTPPRPPRAPLRPRVDPLLLLYGAEILAGTEAAERYVPRAKLYTDTVDSLRDKDNTSLQLYDDIDWFMNFSQDWPATRQKYFNIRMLPYDQAQQLFGDKTSKASIFDGLKSISSWLGTSSMDPAIGYVVEPTDEFDKLVSDAATDTQAREKLNTLNSYLNYLRSKYKDTKQMDLNNSNILDAALVHGLFHIKQPRKFRDWGPPLDEHQVLMTVPPPAKTPAPEYMTNSTLQMETPEYTKSREALIPVQTETLLQSVPELSPGEVNTSNKRLEKIQKINNMLEEYILQKKEQNETANQLLEEIKAVGR